MYHCKDFIPGLHKSPVGLMYSACRKLGLTEFVYISMMRGTYISMTVWKTRLKLLCWQRENIIHKVTSIQYKNATLFNKCILVGKIWPWWEFCKVNPRYVRKCYLILRLITGNNKITERLHTPNASRFCQDCDLMESLIMLNICCFIAPRLYLSLGIYGELSY